MKMKNRTIANMHKMARKFVGYIAAAGTLLAYAGSFITVTVGVIIYAMQSWTRPAGWIFFIVSAVIGAILSLLIERLTLVQAAKIRKGNEERKKIDAAYDKVENRTKAVEANRALELSRVRTGFPMFMLCIGVLASTSAGTLFWHFVMQNLPPWQSWGFSILFAAIISFTLVSSELGKHLDAAVIQEAIGDNHFMALATRADAEDAVLDRFAEHHEAALTNSMNEETIVSMADDAALRTVDRALNGGQGQLPQTVKQGRETRRLAEAAEEDLTRQQMRLIKGGSDEVETGELEVPFPLDARRNA
jgi:mannitol-specific phosphotransferase system IIBC component